MPHEPHDFATVCIASIDARTGEVGLATAGHPSPIVLRPTSIERPLLFANPALGMTEEAELQALPTDYVELAPGDALLLYTDGLSESATARALLRRRPPGRSAGGAARPAGRELLDALIADAGAFAGHAPTDDVALVLIRRTLEEAPDRRRPRIADRAGRRIAKGL